MHKVYENCLDSSSEEELIITDDYKLNPTAHHNIKGKYCFGVNNRFIACMACDEVPSFCLVL